MFEGLFSGEIKPSKVYVVASIVPSRLHVSNLNTFVHHERQALVHPYHDATKADARFTDTFEVYVALFHK